MTNATPEPNVLKAVQMFLSFCAARNDSPNTIRNYNSDLLVFVCCVGRDTPVSAITRKTIRQYLVSLSADLKRSSVHRKLACVRSFCGWLLREGYVDANPSEEIPGPRRHQTLPDVPSEADMKRLLDGTIPGPCPSRDRAVLELLYSCGLRASEAAGVNLEDFRTQGTLLLVRGKGRKERMVPVGRMARRAVKKWQRERKTLLPDVSKMLTAKVRGQLDKIAALRAQGKTQQSIAEELGLAQPVVSRALSGAIVPSGESPQDHSKTKALFFSVGRGLGSERLDVRSIHRIVKQAAEANGLPPYHPHQLRHACATHMHDRGAPIQAISALLGHEKLSTTANVYTRVSSGRMLAVYNQAHPHAETKRRKQ